MTYLDLLTRYLESCVSIQDTASISLRKCKMKGEKITAGDLKCSDAVNKLIQLDEGFRVLRNVRGSIFRQMQKGFICYDKTIR